MAIDQAQVADGRQSGMERSTDFRRPVYCLLGLPIDALRKSEAVERIRASVASRLPCRLVTPNVQHLIATQSDPAFRDAIIGSDLSVADGMPLIWIARLLGVPLKERVAGSDLFEALLRGEGGALKVYFFGGPDGVAEMACKRLNAMSGPVSCVGFASPGFGAVEQMSHPEILDRINRSGADFVVVSLGATKGQAWIELNRNVLNAPVVGHLGAVVNFTAGTVARAPVWLQQIGLEWLWRIKEEPVLWRRYCKDATVLFPLILTRVLPNVIDQALGFLGGARVPAKVVVDDSGSRGGTVTEAGAFRPIRVTLSGSWRESDIPLLRSTFESVSREPGNIELEVRGLRRVNGAFIALLMLLRAHQSALGRSLRVLSPNPGLRRIFRLHCAEFLLEQGGGPSRLMRIVVLGLRGFPNIQGGVETHCEHLFTRIAARGHEVIMLGRKPYMCPALTEYKGVRLVAVACPRQKFLEAFLHTLVGVFKARALSPDILHIHAIGPSLLVPVARLLGMKVVSTNHGPDYDREKWGGIARAILRIGESLGSRFSNGVIAISEPIAEHLRKTFGRKPAVIPNGVVTRPPSEGRDVLGQFGLDRGRYLLAVGRLVPEKGFHDLLEAFVKSDLPGWKLVVAGRADHEDAYSLGLKQKAAAIPGVVMTGFVTGELLVQLYSHAGLFVLPSYHEGLPIVLLEAMSYGLSVVASDIPANRQAGLHEDRFFPPGNVDSAATKIHYHALRSLMPDERKAQIAFVARNFDWDSITNKTIGFYGTVLEKGRNPA